MHILAYVTLDAVVWLLSIVIIIGSFIIALFGEDIGEPWLTLLILVLVLACVILTGLR